MGRRLIFALVDCMRAIKKATTPLFHADLRGGEVNRKGRQEKMNVAAGYIPDPLIAPSGKIWSAAGIARLAAALCRIGVDDPRRCCGAEKNGKDHHECRKRKTPPAGAGTD